MMCDPPPHLALIKASKNGDFEEVTNLLKKHFPVHYTDKDNATALYWGSSRGHVRIVQALIAAGSDVNAQVVWGSTALHAATDRGRIDAVNLLIHSEADINIKNQRGDTPLHIGAYRGYDDIVKLLITYKADASIRNEKGRTAADEAEGNNNQLVAHLLLQYMNGANRYSGDDVSFAHTSQFAKPNRSNDVGSLHKPLKYSKSADDRNVSGSYVRYATDLMGFKRQHRQAEESMDDSAPYLMVGGATEHQEIVPERNGNGNRKTPGTLSPFYDNKENEQSLVHDGVRYPPNFHNENGGIVNSITGSYEDIRVRPNDSNDVRRSRISVGCVREIATKTHSTAIESFAESLQVELFKKREELEEVLKQKNVMEQDLNHKLQQYKYACEHLQNENLSLKASNTTRNSTQRTNQLQTHNLGDSLSHEGILRFLNTVASRQTNCSQSNQMMLALKENLQTHWLDFENPSQLEVPNKEWFPGQDYVLIGDKPINHFCDGKRDGCCSLVFQIKQKNRNLVLKMVINLINMDYSGHGEGHSLDEFLQRSFGAEHDLPVCLSKHFNIVKIRHHYIGATERFKKYLNLLVPNKLDVRIEMASRTTFLVMDYYPISLKSLVLQQRTMNHNPPYGLDLKFILHLLYQILSAVYYLQKNGVIHRDIKADNIFLDNHLRPLLGDFGMARLVQEPDGKAIPYTNNKQVLAGNGHAWAPELSRWNRNGPLTTGVVALKQIYAKSDAYAVSRMFYSLLRPISADDTFPQSSIERPHYDNSEIPELPEMYPVGLRHILRQLVLNNPLDRLTDRKAMLYIGMLMFSPEPGELTMESDVALYIQARMLKLLAVKRQDSLPLTSTEYLPIERSVDIVDPIIEADFFHSITPEEFWEIYQDLKQRNFLINDNSICT